MNKMTVTKVRTGQKNTNPAITTLVYREKSYPAREVQGKDGNYTVSVERLEQELLDGIKSLDPAAFELDESIAYYCTEEEIRTLPDEELDEMIYSYRKERTPGHDGPGKGYGPSSRTVPFQKGASRNAPLCTSVRKSGRPE